MYSANNLTQLTHLKGLAPTSMHAFETLDRAAMAAGAISRKYKELIALAVALTTQCPYSLEVHRTNAINAGATEAEIAEVILLRRQCGQPPQLLTGLTLSDRGDPKLQSDEMA